MRWCELKVFDAVSINNKRSYMKGGLVPSIGLPFVAPRAINSITPLVITLISFNG